jgi:glycosyltransferase involved in cell wall biosynthesis
LSPQIPALLNWPIATTSGWGIVSLNLFLHWANDPDLAPLVGGPIGPNEMAGVDPLRVLGVRDAILRSNAFQADLQRARSGSRSLAMPIIEGLGNGLYFADGLRGTRTIGRCIFEDTRLADLDTKLAKYDLLLCASQWNADLLRANCTKPVAVVHEGIDPSLFHPAPKSGVLPRDRFYIFSGGKVEFRKGHDLTLLAFREFSRRHDDAVLVTFWHSPWPQLSIGFRGKLDSPLGQTADGRIDVKNWVARNGIDPAKVLEIGPVPNGIMPSILREMDCALAPSRAEACTNLLAKEAMACGLPLIIAPNTGVKDLVADGNCVALTRQEPVRGFDQCGTEGWGESDAEEIVDALERFYSDSSLRATIGKRGAEWLLENDRSWRSHARQVKSLLLSA